MRCGVGYPTPCTAELRGKEASDQMRGAVTVAELSNAFKMKLAQTHDYITSEWSPHRYTASVRACLRLGPRG